jgi:hypothetical protein
MRESLTNIHPLFYIQRPLAPNPLAKGSNYLFLFPADGEGRLA